jgi:NAD(P)-dependent dehydrogenase (short-subunit alcohol dehydrogenase family)
VNAEAASVSTIAAADAAVAAGAARLDGKVAIVTGAGSRDGGVGVGRATAVALARAGASVCLVDIDIDVLVNNAAVLDQRAPLHELDPEHWEAVLTVNLKGAVLMSRAVLPALFEAGGGSIINISSAAGVLAGGTTAYGPAKAGLNQLTRELALAYGSRLIRVNAIAPGDIDTPMAATNQPAGAQDARAKLTPLALRGTAWDVAALAVFLASDAARFVSGAVIPVDGAASSTLVFAAYRLMSP